MIFLKKQLTKLRIKLNIPPFRATLKEDCIGALNMLLIIQIIHNFFE